MARGPIKRRFEMVFECVMRVRLRERGMYASQYCRAVCWDSVRTAEVLTEREKVDVGS